MTIIERARMLRPIIEQAAQSLEDKTASISAELFPRMKLDDNLIRAGTRINDNGRVLRAAVDLWDSQENTPQNAPTLWEELEYREGYRIIPDPITVTSRFSRGERGWWGDVLYESLVNDNVYTPTQYPENWAEVKDKGSEIDG